MGRKNVAFSASCVSSFIAMLSEGIQTKNMMHKALPELTEYKSDTAYILTRYRPAMPLKKIF